MVLQGLKTSKTNKLTTNPFRAIYWLGIMEEIGTLTLFKYLERRNSK